MTFNIWSPPGESAVIRIYTDGNDDAYIWRRSTRNPLTIEGASFNRQCQIKRFLLSRGIDIDTTPSRRALVQQLCEKGLLSGSRSHHGGFNSKPSSQGADSMGLKDFKSNVITFPCRFTQSDNA